MTPTIDRHPHTLGRNHLRSRRLHRTATGMVLVAMVAACGSDDVDNAAPVTTAGAISTIAEPTVADTSRSTSSTTTTAPPTTGPTTTEPTTTASPPSTDAPSTDVPTTTAAPTTTQAAKVSFPESFRGSWRQSESGDVTPGQCSEDSSAVENFGKVLSIRAEGFSFFESGGRLLEVHERTDNRFEATFDTTYADTPTQDRLVFDLVEGGAAVTLSGGENVASEPDTIRYARCPEETPLTAAEVDEFIISLGDWAPDTSTYDPTAALSAVEAVSPGAASAASPEQIFLFESGRYVGTPLPSRVSLPRSNGSTVPLCASPTATTHPVIRSAAPASIRGSSMCVGRAARSSTTATWHHVIKASADRPVVHGHHSHRWSRLTDERRLDLPVTIVCPEFDPDQARRWIAAGDVPELARNEPFAWDTVAQLVERNDCSPRLAVG